MTAVVVPSNGRHRCSRRRPRDAGHALGRRMVPRPRRCCRRWGRGV